MATMQDALNSITTLSTTNESLTTKVNQLIAANTDAFNRLDAKIAQLQAQITAGVDTQPIIDALTPIAQSQSDTIPKVDSAIAQDLVEGQQLKKWLLLFFALSSVSYVSYGVLSKTYPTSPVTQIRMDAYMDSITEIYNSTSTDSVALINRILDNDIEEYLVLPSTYNATGNWKGWCMASNGVAIPCP